MTGGIGGGMPGELGAVFVSVVPSMAGSSAQVVKESEELALVVSKTFGKDLQRLLPAEMQAAMRVAGQTGGPALMQALGGMRGELGKVGSQWGDELGKATTAGFGATAKFLGAQLIEIGQQQKAVAAKVGTEVGDDLGKAVAAGFGATANFLGAQLMAIEREHKAVLARMKAETATAQAQFARAAQQVGSPQKFVPEMPLIYGSGAAADFQVAAYTASNPKLAKVLDDRRKIELDDLAERQRIQAERAAVNRAAAQSDLQAAYGGNAYRTASAKSPYTSAVDNYTKASAASAKAAAKEAAEASNAAALDSMRAWAKSAEGTESAFRKLGPGILNALGGPLAKFGPLFNTHVVNEARLGAQAMEQEIGKLKPGEKIADNMDKVHANVAGKMADLGKLGAEAAAGAALAVGAVMLDVGAKNIAAVIKLYSSEFQQLGKVGAEAGHALMDGFQSLVEGKMPDIMGAFNVLEDYFKTMWQAPQAAFNTFMDMTIGHIPLIGNAFKGVVSEVEGAINSLFPMFDELKNLGGQFLGVMVDMGQQWQDIARGIAGQTTTNEKMREYLGIVHEVSQSGLILHFKDVAAIVGELGQRFDGLNHGAGMSSEQLKELASTVAQANELLGNIHINIDGMTAAFNQFDIPAEKVNGMMVEFTNIARTTGADINELFHDVEASGPAFQELGLSMEQVFYTMAKMNEELGKPAMQRMVLSLRGLPEQFAKMGLDPKLAFSSYTKELVDLIKKDPTLSDALKLSVAVGFSRAAASTIVGAVNLGIKNGQTIFGSPEDLQKAVDLMKEGPEKILTPLEEALKATQGIKDALEKISTQILGALAPLATGLAAALKNAGNSVSDWIKTHQEQIIGWSGKAMHTVLTLGVNVLSTLKSVLAGTAPMVVSFAKITLTALLQVDQMLQHILGTLSHVPEWAWKAAGTVGGLITGELTTGSVIGGLTGAVAGYNAVPSGIPQATRSMSDALGATQGPLAQAEALIDKDLGPLLDNVGKGLGTVSDVIKDKLVPKLDEVSESAGKEARSRERQGGVGGSLGTPTRPAPGAAGPSPEVLQSLFPDEADTSGAALNAPVGQYVPLPGFAPGGRVNSRGWVEGQWTGGDSVPVHLPNAGFVVKRPQAQKYAGLLDRLSPSYSPGGGGPVNAMVEVGEKIVPPGAADLGLLNAINSGTRGYDAGGVSDVNIADPIKQDFVGKNVLYGFLRGLAKGVGINIPLGQPKGYYPQLEVYPSTPSASASTTTTSPSTRSPYASVAPAGAAPQGGSKASIAKYIYQAVTGAGYSQATGLYAVAAADFESGINPEQWEKGGTDHYGLFQEDGAKPRSGVAQQVGWFLSALAAAGGPSVVNANPANVIANKVEVGGYSGSSYNSHIAQARSLLGFAQGGCMDGTCGQPACPVCKAYGGVLQGFTGGGGYGSAGAYSSNPNGDDDQGVVPEISGAEQIAHQFSLRLTAGRSGHGTHDVDGGYHDSGQAGDFSNGVETPQEAAFATYMAQNYGGQIAELIHYGAGWDANYNIKNGKFIKDYGGVPSVYDMGTLTGHRDHVHVAIRSGTAAGGGKPQMAMGSANLAGFGGNQGLNAGGGGGGGGGPQQATLVSAFSGGTLAPSIAGDNGGGGVAGPPVPSQFEPEFQALIASGYQGRNPWTNIPPGTIPNSQPWLEYQSKFLTWMNEWFKSGDTVKQAVINQGKAHEAVTKAEREYATQLAKYNQLKSTPFLLDEHTGKPMINAATGQPASNPKLTEAQTALQNMEPNVKTAREQAEQADKAVTEAARGAQIQSLTEAPAPPKGDDERYSSMAENLGTNLIKGMAQEFGLGDVWKNASGGSIKPPWEWGIWKLFAGGMSFGADLLNQPQRGVTGGPPPGLGPDFLPTTSSPSGTPQMPGASPSGTPQLPGAAPGGGPLGQGPGSLIQLGDVGGLPPGKAPEAGLQPNAVKTDRAISAAFPEIQAIGGVRPDALHWHPDGLALDVMIPGAGGPNDPTPPAAKAEGDKIWAWLGEHASELGIDMGASIWQKPDHFNHIHVAVYGKNNPGPGDGAQLPSLPGVVPQAPQPQPQLPTAPQYVPQAPQPQYVPQAAPQPQPQLPTAPQPQSVPQLPVAPPQWVPQAPAALPSGPGSAPGPAPVPQQSPQTPQQQPQGTHAGGSAGLPATTTPPPHPSAPTTPHDFWGHLVQPPKPPLPGLPPTGEQHQVGTPAPPPATTSPPGTASKGFSWGGMWQAAKDTFSRPGEFFGNLFGSRPPPIGPETHPVAPPSDTGKIDQYLSILQQQRADPRTSTFGPRFSDVPGSPVVGRGVGGGPSAPQPIAPNLGPNIPLPVDVAKWGNTPVPLPGTSGALAAILGGGTANLAPIDTPGAGPRLDQYLNILQQPHGDPKSLAFGPGGMPTLQNMQNALLPSWQQPYLNALQQPGDPKSLAFGPGMPTLLPSWQQRLSPILPGAPGNPPLTPGGVPTQDFLNNQFFNRHTDPSAILNPPPGKPGVSLLPGTGVMSSEDLQNALKNRPLSPQQRQQLQQQLPGPWSPPGEPGLGQPFPAVPGMGTAGVGGGLGSVASTQGQGLPIATDLIGVGATLFSGAASGNIGSSFKGLGARAATALSNLIDPSIASAMRPASPEPQPAGAAGGPGGPTINLHGTNVINAEGAKTLADAVTPQVMAAQQNVPTAMAGGADSYLRAN